MLLLLLSLLLLLLYIYIYTHTSHTIHTIYNLKNLLRFEFLNLWTVGHLWESFEPIFGHGHGQVSGTEPTAKLRFHEEGWDFWVIPKFPIFFRWWGWIYIYIYVYILYYYIYIYVYIIYYIYIYILYIYIWPLIIEYQTPASWCKWCQS